MDFPYNLCFKDDNFGLVTFPHYSEWDTVWALSIHAGLCHASDMSASAMQVICRPHVLHGHMTLFR